jgi:DNA modification methylase
MEIVKIEAIKANSKNPRVIKDDKFRKLVQSIREFPDMLNKRPLICFTDVDKKYVVLGGNMRLRAAQEIGLKEMPIILADDWTQEQKDEFLIKDNVGFGEWNWDDLANEWDAELLDNWGLDIPNFDKEVLEAEEDDFDTTPPEDPITVLGDLYEIGEHRLLCGDSTDSDQVSKLMNGQKADMVFTDPPYYEVCGDFDFTFDTYSDYLKMIKKSYLNADSVVDNGSFYICLWYKFLFDVQPVLTEALDAQYQNLIIWDNTRHRNTTKQYSNSYEPILFYTKGDYCFDDKNNKVPYEDTSNYKRYNKEGKSIEDIIRVSNIRRNSQEAEAHPTQKPIELIAIFISVSSKIGNLVVDFFLGSGTTMVAAHQLKRKCYGMELDPKYCDVIVNRMTALDPDIKIKLNSKPFEKAH